VRFIPGDSTIEWELDFLLFSVTMLSPVECKAFHPDVDRFTIREFAFERNSTRSPSG
jgi:hypothetical protein